MSWNVGPGIIFFLCGIFVAGCARNTASAEDVNSPAPRDTGGTFDSHAGAVTLTWPPGWDMHPSKDLELLLWPSGAASEPDQSISLDVPDLPVHVPGLIPLFSVRNGYLDDLKHEVGQLNVQDLSPPTIPDAKADLVKSTWQSGGRKFSEIALLMVHNDHVYIIRGRSDSDHEAAVRSAFDQVVGSLHWDAKRSP